LACGANPGKRHEADHRIGGSSLLAAASSPSNAQVLKQEPLEGKMVPGSVLLVDDGTCGKGKIKQVTGGETGAMNPRPRTRKCIPKVTK
jgi:hypothetical protein